MPFSYSQLSLYRTCPRQYEFACVKKIPRQISAGESFGSSVHNTLSKWGKLEMTAGKLASWQAGYQIPLFADNHQHQSQLPTANRLLELWHTSFITEGYATKTDADSARKKGERMMCDFYDWWQQKERNVLAVERGFTIAAEGAEGTNGADVTSSAPSATSALFSIKGRFDRVEKAPDGVRIIDFKTGAPRNQEAVDADLQLSIYALAAKEAFGLPCSELSLLFLREDGITEVKTTRSKQQLEQAMSEMDELVEGIDTDDFAPTPSQPVCGRCPYRGICDAAEV